MTELRTGSETKLLATAFARIDVAALALAFGTIAGCGLWLLTAALLVQGGVDVGAHLGRLAYFLPGYRVTWSGAFLGCVEAGLLGAALGAGLALFWNAYHRLFLALALARARARELQDL